MKKNIIALLISSMGLVAAGETADALVLTAITADRTRVLAERMAQELRFDTLEAACYKRFFVNSCLNELAPQRRDILKDLKNQDVALAERERQIKAAEQIRKAGERSSLEAMQQAAERRAKALEDTQAREEQSRLKAEDRMSLKANESLSAAEAAKRAVVTQEKAQSRSQKQATSADEVKKFKDKQQEVANRQVSREKRLLEKKKPAAAPLPETR
jgi:colicin import membrane protein